ncbi:hypothetical protein [Curtobacterium sp. MCBD17_008]|uniref:hypothetical protein n=1 Tax=Curtobacterium sp. MCBD17_008 TaxID=2175656 RepID=UPI000DA7C062|nr:hypothetical protein [Curtobacterium sp. MCBD17_008]PZE90063.1 hypothetical protein DEI95_12475 [Curtobacterium sp. MCBD17_008]
MTTRVDAHRRQPDVGALIAILLVVAWCAVLVTTGALGPQRDTPPSLFDQAGGQLSTAAAGASATLQAFVLIGSLPVSVVALWISVRSLRRWRQPVTAVVATTVSSLATLVGIGLAWIGFGTFVFSS